MKHTVNYNIYKHVILCQKLHFETRYVRIKVRKHILPPYVIF